MIAGVVFRIGDRHHFLPAAVAQKVMSMPEVARMPGGPPELRGVALVDGNMIPIVDVNPLEAPPSSLRDLRQPRELRTPSSKAMLVALVPSSPLGGAAGLEPVGLVGLDVVATGSFESEDGISARWGAAYAQPFDVVEAIARVREGLWAV